MTATYISDGTVQISPSALLPDSPPAFWEQNTHLLDADGYLVIGAGGLLVQGSGWSLLIDTGLGPLDNVPSLDGLGTVTGGALVSSLARHGVTPAELSAVAITHLHADHVGWWANGADAAGRGPFADLPAYIGAEGWEHGRNTADPTLTPVITALADNVRPVADGTTIAPGVSVLHTPGHTAEHTSYVIESGGETLIAFGDAFHSAAQIAHPEWADGMDHDTRTARVTREALLSRLIRPDTYGFGVHFADVTFGRVIPVPDGFAWQPRA
ncbi:MBL fold metallo-hydrolase [Mycobacterium sp. PS03-16]|uniref:MBL fold metallo-hydrolase n=1 Tax=Mycobacterium sp. PS03-16 TaxID=2559611 RepID=UPI001ADDA6CE|nr:MBL fold metallo-hydrolase [Mycobacterium sp. PS03-16]